MIPCMSLASFWMCVQSWTWVLVANRRLDTITCTRVAWTGYLLTIPATKEQASVTVKEGLPHDPRLSLGRSLNRHSRSVAYMPVLQMELPRCQQRKARHNNEACSVKIAETSTCQCGVCTFAS